MGHRGSRARPRSSAGVTSSQVGDRCVGGGEAEPCERDRSSGGLPNGCVPRKGMVNAARTPDKCMSYRSRRRKRFIRRAQKKSRAAEAEVARVLRVRTKLDLALIAALDRVAAAYSSVPESARPSRSEGPLESLELAIDRAYARGDRAGTLRAIREWESHAVREFTELARASGRG